VLGYKDNFKQYKVEQNTLYQPHLIKAICKISCLMVQSWLNCTNWLDKIDCTRL